MRTTSLTSQDEDARSAKSTMPHVNVAVDEGNKRTRIDVRTLIVLMEEAIAEGKVEDVPAFLGELERLKAILWSRMITVSCSSMSNHPSDAVTLLTMPQVAKRLAIPEGRAYELARQGKLPTVKVGKYVRVSVAELEKWVARQISLERQIDREPPDFHSALAGRERSARVFTGTKTRPFGARRKSQLKIPVGFQPQDATPCAAKKPGSVEAEGVHDEE